VRRHPHASSPSFQFFFISCACYPFGPSISSSLRYRQVLPHLLTLNRFLFFCFLLLSSIGTRGYFRDLRLRDRPCVYDNLSEIVVGKSLTIAKIGMRASHSKYFRGSPTPSNNVNVEDSYGQQHQVCVFIGHCISWQCNDQSSESRASLQI
jgi:hypothetical protein